MYLYCVPKGGFNDMFTQLLICMKYCKKMNRIFLLDTINSEYRINFDEYFSFNESISKNLQIISDYNQIKKIILENPDYSIYPNCFQGRMEEILDGKLKMNILNNTYVDLDNKKITLPPSIVKEDILVCINWGGGNGFTLFSQLIIKPHIINYCQNLYNQIPKPYISIQIRNTDYKCDYEKIYNDHKDLIHSYKAVYIATDDKKSIEFFKNKNINVYNFCNFPESENYLNLHYSTEIQPDVKIKDLLADILIVSLSDKLLSNSKGLFIYFLYNTFVNKNVIKKMFEIVS